MVAYVHTYIQIYVLYVIQNHFLLIMSSFLSSAPGHVSAVGIGIDSRKVFKQEKVPPHQTYSYAQTNSHLNSEYSGSSELQLICLCACESAGFLVEISTLHRVCFQIKTWDLPAHLCVSAFGLSTTQLVGYAPVILVFSVTISHSHLL